MYNKMEEFKSIRTKLEEVRTLCNRARIPFIYVAALYDDDQKTKYASFIDANNGSSFDSEQYDCNGLIPRTMGYEFTDIDNRIVQIARIMNGEVAVPVENKEHEKNFEIIETLSSKIGEEFKSMYNVDLDGTIAVDDEEDTSFILNEFSAKERANLEEIDEYDTEDDYED